MSGIRSKPEIDVRSGPVLSVLGVSKTYGETVAVDELSLTLRRGEILGLLGPSGCGKTTTLRLILGLEMPDQGRVEFAGQDITASAPERRGFGIVFQNYALFTKLNVFDNVAFGLDPRTRTVTEIRERVERLLAMVRLPMEYASRSVTELSAGEQQRVALARAVATEPPLLLLDEPLANLDVGLRHHTGMEIRKIIKQVNIAAIYVTHDHSEAFTLCDRLAVMSRGRLVQMGTPRDVYEHPAQLFIAQFFGFNILPARRVDPSQGVARDFETLDRSWRLRVVASSSDTWPEDDRCTLAIRPEDIHVGTEEQGRGNTTQARVREIIFSGPLTRLALDVHGHTLEAILVSAPGLSADDECVIEIPTDRPIIFRELT